MGYLEATVEISDDHSKRMTFPGWNDESYIAFERGKLRLFTGRSVAENCSPREEEIRSSDWIVYTPAAPKASS